MNAKVKKRFLLACMNHGSLTVSQVNDILPPICRANNVEPPSTSRELKVLVNSINEDINEFNQALKFVKHPLLQTEYLVFVLTMETEIARRPGVYSAIDRYFFGKLLEALVNGENYGMHWVSVYEVANLIPQQRKELKKERIQELVHKWSAQGYFVEKEEMLYFGPRMIVEFAPYLKRNFPQLIKDCNLCNQVVFWGVKCSDCSSEMHRKCIRKYLVRKSNCPVCKCVWNTRLSID